MFLVLFVDDEEEILDLGKTFLEQSGELHIDTATSIRIGFVAKLQLVNYRAE